MKKILTQALSVLFGTVIASSSIITYEAKVDSNADKVQISSDASNYLAANLEEIVVNSDISLTMSAADVTYENALAQPVIETSVAALSVEEAKPEKEVDSAAVAVSIKPKNKTIASRGGEAPTGTISSAKSAEKKTSSSNDSSKFDGKKVELLDWWKSGNSAFPTGSAVTVKDVYSGKTFKIKRTMGSNHADCEALTLQDTKTIKAIWGGFNWDARPIHIYIDGRVLAASMTSKPHAGVDSAPAFATVRNRSDGYGTGQNLDVIKNNGMDGHFDVHFLNSTRHKDGNEDSRHQSAIKVAAARD
jgi:hypothetical protein